MSADPGVAENGLRLTTNRRGPFPRSRHIQTSNWRYSGRQRFGDLVAQFLRC